MFSRQPSTEAINMERLFGFFALLSHSDWEEAETLSRTKVSPVSICNMNTENVLEWIYVFTLCVLPEFQMCPVYPWSHFSRLDPCNRRSAASCHRSHTSL